MDLIINKPTLFLKCIMLEAVFNFYHKIWVYSIKLKCTLYNKISKSWALDF